MKSAAILLLAGLALASTIPAAAAAAGAKHFAYNDTAVTTFTGVYLAPAATTEWGPNQALNDDDKELDFGERLTLTGLNPGVYDVRLVDKQGRICILHHVDLTKAMSFDIRDSSLTNCK